MITASKAPLRGVIPIIPTPFHEDGSLDCAGLDTVINYLAGVGVAGVAVLGMASEAITVTEGERDQIITRAASVVGDLPLVAGCSHISPQGVAELAAASERAGADVLMVMPPSLGNPDADALIDYFVAAADAVTVPIMIQDNPGWTGVPIPIEVYRRIAEHQRIRYAKIETQHPPTTIRAVTAAVGDQLAILGGQAGTWLPEELASGIVGTMPAAIMPQVYLAIWQAWAEGDTTRALRLFDRFHPLIRVSGVPRLGIPMAKWLLAEQGVLSSPTVRAPFRQLGADDLADLIAVVDRIGIRDVMAGSSPVALAASV